METVQRGVGMLAASRNPADLQLLTQIDFTTAENIRFFVAATKRALQRRRRGEEFLTELSGAAMVITPTDSATPRAIALLGANIVGGVRDWAKGIFREDVRPVIAREWEYTAPTAEPRGWFARMFNPAPSWEFPLGQHPHEGGVARRASWRAPWELGQAHRADDGYIHGFGSGDAYSRLERSSQVGPVLRGVRRIYGVRGVHREPRIRAAGH